MKKELRWITVMVLQHLVAGLLWILYGVCSLFDQLFFRVVSVLAIAGIIVILAVSFFSRREREDEMGRRHLEKARAAGYLWMMLFVVLGYLLHLGGIQLELVTCLPFFLGGLELVVGILFVWYEKKGESGCRF